MATLEESVELCKIPIKTEILGLAKHQQHNCVIITLQHREVLIYNVADRKIVKSWSIEPKQHLSCHAVQDKSSKYYLIKNQRELLIWNNSVSDLRNADIVELPKDAKEIYINPCLNHEPIIIFKDNQLLPLSLITTPSNIKHKLQHNQSLLWYKTYQCKNKLIWLTKLLHNKKSASYFVVIQQYDNISHEAEETVYNLRKPKSNEHLLCWSLLDDNKVFISLWSDGCLYKSYLPSFDKKDIYCELVAKLPSLSKSVPCLLTNVSSMFICIARCCNTEYTVSLWDMKFGICHAEKIVPQKMLNHILCLDNFILLPNNDSILSYGYHTVPSTLLNSLGSQNIHRDAIQPLFLSSPKIIKPNEDIKIWCENISEEDKCETTFLQTINHPKLTPEQLKKEIKAYQLNAKGCRTSQHVITYLLEQCVNDNNLWSQDIAQFFIENRYIPQRYFKQFIGMVLASNDINILMSCVNKLNGIPEHCIVSCLQYVLMTDNTQFQQNNSKEWSDTDPPFTLSKTQALCTILAYPVNDCFIQEAMKTLSHEEIVLFVRFMSHLIQNWIYFHKTNILNCKTLAMTYTQVLDWASLLFTTQFTQIILFSEIHSLLADLHDIVSKQITICEYFEEVKCYLTYFKQNKCLPKKQVLGSYSLESIEF